MSQYAESTEKRFIQLPTYDTSNSAFYLACTTSLSMKVAGLYLYLLRVLQLTRILLPGRSSLLKEVQSLNNTLKPRLPDQFDVVWDQFFPLRRDGQSLGCRIRCPDCRSAHLASRLLQIDLVDNDALWRIHLTFRVALVSINTEMRLGAYQSSVVAKYFLDSVEMFVNALNARSGVWRQCRKQERSDRQFRVSISATARLRISGSRKSRLCLAW